MVVGLSERERAMSERDDAAGAALLIALAMIGAGLVLSIVLMWIWWTYLLPMVRLY